MQHYLRRNPKQIRILAFGNSLTEGYCDFGTRFHPYGPTLQSELTTLLQISADTKIKVDVNGLSGDRVLRSLDGIFIDRLKAALDAADATTDGGYDFVTLLGGTNDLAYTFGDPEGPVKIFEGLEECYNLVLESGASLVCLTVPERFLDTKNNDVGRQGSAARFELNALIERYALEHNNKDGAASVTANSEGELKVFVCDIASKMPFKRVETEDGSLPQDEGFWSADGLHMTATGYDNFGRELARFIAALLKER